MLTLAVINFHSSDFWSDSDYLLPGIKLLIGASPTFVENGISLSLVAQACTTVNTSFPSCQHPLTHPCSRERPSGWGHLRPDVRRRRLLHESRWGASHLVSRLYSDIIRESLPSRDQRLQPADHTHSECPQERATREPAVELPGSVYFRARAAKRVELLFDFTLVPPCICVF